MNELKPFAAPGWITVTPKRRAPEGAAGSGLPRDDCLPPADIER
ncbi:MAG TPA: hypothetical protein VG432_16440 [Gemmatimonadaceae bacterium]|nr:hypothetical protein [Gemmatimonadaceae bacterium]